MPKQHKIDILCLYKVVFPNDKDLNAKIKWLKVNDHKKYYWWQWLALNDIREMLKDKFIPEIDDMGDWMIRERTVQVRETKICFNPRAFCWESGRSLFLKPATVVHTLVTGPGDPLKEKFYFSPKHYTLWMMKQ